MLSGAATRETDWRAIFALPATSRPDSVAAVDAIKGLLNDEHAYRVHIIDYTDLAERLAR